MAHCPYPELADLEDVLETVRSWADIREKSPGVFYVKAKPFLHFHLNKAGERWADVRGSGDWEKVDVAKPASARARAALTREAARHHGVLTAKKSR